MYRVFEYSVARPKGSNHYRTKKAKLVKKFSDLRSAQEFIEGKSRTYIQFPKYIMQDMQK